MPGEVKQTNEKNISHEQFRIKILKPHLVKMAVDHIRDTTYAATSVARVMDLHHGFKINGLDSFRLLGPAHLGEKVCANVLIHIR
jgi:hypothetical protein